MHNVCQPCRDAVTDAVRKSVLLFGITGKFPFRQPDSGYGKCSGFILFSGNGAFVFSITTPTGYNIMSFDALPLWFRIRSGNH